MPFLALASLAPFFDIVFSQMSHTISPVLMLHSCFLHYLNKVLSRRIERHFYSRQLAVLSGLMFLSLSKASRQAEPYYFKAAICDPNINK